MVVFDDFTKVINEMRESRERELLKVLDPRPDFSPEELKWHHRFLDLCDQVATWSKDRSTKLGCVIIKDRRVLATGYNGFTPGIDDEKDSNHERPRKYFITEHCERNALYQAAQMGIALRGATIYTNAPPCHDCARGIKQSGLVEAVWPENNPFENNPATRERWKDSLDAALEILEAGKVAIRRVPDKNE